MRLKLLLFLGSLLGIVVLGGWRMARSHARRAVLDSREIRMAVGTMPMTLDWSTSSSPSDVNYPVILAMMRGLARLDDRYQPVPDLAESWEVENLPGAQKGTSLLFHLRKDVLWSDGKTPLRARAFVLGWRRAAMGVDGGEMEDVAGIEELVEARNRDPHLPADRLRQLLEGIGATALDDHTLRVRLRAPASYFLHRLALVYVFYPVPSADLEGLDERRARDYFDEPRDGKPLVLGAYLPERWDRLRRLIRLARNPHGNPNPGAPDHFTLYQSALAPVLYERDKADFLLVQDAQSIWKPAPDTRTRPLLSTGWLGFNTDRVPETLRRAIACGLDREALMKAVLPAPRVAFTLLPHDLTLPGAVRPDDPLARAFPRFDPVEARRLFALAGPVRERLQLLVHKESLMPEEEMARGIQRQLQAYGIAVEVVASAQFNKDLKTLRPHCFLKRTGADYNHPQTFFVVHTPGGNNGSQWKNVDQGRAIRAFERLVQQAGAETDPQRMRETYSRAQELLLARHVVLVPLYHPDRHFRRKPWVQGLEFDPFNNMDLRAMALGRR